MSLEFINEGHYCIGEIQYMSIWTFKRKNGIYPNDNETNYQDAKNIQCVDRIWKPFNQSNQFREGWHYNIECLNNYYNQ